jgi:anthranilate phosphoribosyltransferase
MDNIDKLKLFNDLFNKRLSPIEAKDFLVYLYNNGETTEDILQATKLMRENAILLPIDDSLKDNLIDNCGTGGDKSGSFNISTTVSIVLNACGCMVAKHGNRSITSKSGSADVLESLGVNLNLSLDKQSTMLQEVGFVFMFAKNHHPIMKYIMPIRESISHRTIFNILGPLTNPASATKQLIGVFDRDYISKIATVIKALGAKSAMVVSSRDNMDEISISDITYATVLRNDKLIDIEIDPQNYGFKLYDKREILGGTVLQNSEIMYNILCNKEEGAKRDIVLLNSGVALFVDGIAQSVEHGIEMARESIVDLKTKKSLEKIVKISNQL